MSRPIAGLVVVCLLSIALPAHAQQAARVSAARPTRMLQAARASTRLVIDGRFDEPDWARASVADSFRQRSPDAGALSTERTIVRVLYDDQALYVGASLLDSRPDSIFAVLGRRDGGTPSDEFFVALDSYHDRRTAFVFSVTPHGVQSDMKIYGEYGFDSEWNAVWEARTRQDSSGWYAELRIPFSQLRFSGGDSAGLTWGLNFFRWIARKGEDTNWSLMPSGGPPLVSYYGELRGMRLSRAPRRLELMPYSLARVQRAPGDLADPLYRRTDPFATLGADLRYALSSNFTLSASVNPDFGQVEADPSEVNLTGFETFFREQRPFFVEGSDLTQYSTGGSLTGDEPLFYSRRIGRRPQLDMPDEARFTSALSASTILGAAKVSGKTASGWSVAAVAAVTGRERARFIDSSGDAHDHLVEPLTQYAVGRLTKDFRGGASSVGFMATAVHRELPTDAARAALRQGEYVAGLDTRHRIFGDRIQASAFALASYTNGSASAIDEIQRSSIHLLQRPDATHLRYDPGRTSLSGVTAGWRLWKMSGSNWRWGLNGRAVTPGFDMNDLGFQRSSDVLETTGWFGYDQSAARGAFRSWWLFVNDGFQWSFGGERQIATVNMYGMMSFRNFWSLRGGVDRYFSARSASLLRGGPSVAVPPATSFSVDLESDRRGQLSGTLSVGNRREHGTPTRNTYVQPMITVRAPAQLQLSAGPSFSWSRTAWQYVTDETALGAQRYVVGDLRQSTTSLAIRANYTFSPTMTLQAYAQPFTSAGRYQGFRLPSDTRAPDANARFAPLAEPSIQHDAAVGRYAVDLNGDAREDFGFDDPDFNTQELIANTVLRWEYRPGSALFVVWSQQRSSDGGAVPYALRSDAKRLFASQPTNVLLVKVSYWLNR